MATRANAATVKGATNTTSSESSSVLRPDAPPLRTAEQLLKKNEQIADAIEHNRVTPKQAEQLNQNLKNVMRLASMTQGYLSMLAKLRKAGERAIPVPRDPLLRSLIGLPEAISPTDGAYVRGELSD